MEKLSESDSEKKVPSAGGATGTGTKDSIASGSEYDKLDTSKKARIFTVIAYPESLPGLPEGASKDDANAHLIEIMDSLCVPYAISPLHDADVLSDGSLKKPHWHIVIKWRNTTTIKAVIKHVCPALGCPMYAKIVASMRLMLRYLAHQDNPEKAQYNPAEVIYHGIDPSDYAEQTRALTPAEKRLYSLEVLKAIKEVGWLDFDEALLGVADLDGGDLYTNWLFSATGLRLVESCVKANYHRADRRYHLWLTSVHQQEQDESGDKQDDTDGTDGSDRG